MTSLLNENTLFRSRKITSYNLREVTDLFFLWCVSLHILRQEYETAPWAYRYAQQTSNHGTFYNIDISNTDLYQALWVLSNYEKGNSKFNNDADELLWHNMYYNSNTVIRFLKNCTNAKYNVNLQRSLLLQLEQQLHITTNNYRSLRRLCVEWNTGQIDTQAKQLVVTRLLQALRYKARRGEVLPQLEKLANLKHYELTNVCNPETGETNDHKDLIIKPTPQMSLFKKLAIAAAAVGSTALLLSKAK